MSLIEILDAREKRWNLKCGLAADEKRSVVSLTLRMPSELRLSENAEKALAAGREEVFALLKSEFSAVSFKGQFSSADGPYALFTVSGDETEIKKRLVRFEEESRFGDLIDADVMNRDCEEISRLTVGGKARKCLVCGKNDARICAKEGVHTREYTIEAIKTILANRLEKGE